MEKPLVIWNKDNYFIQQVEKTLELLREMETGTEGEQQLEVGEMVNYWELVLKDNQ